MSSRWERPELPVAPEDAPFGLVTAVVALALQDCGGSPGLALGELAESWVARHVDFAALAKMVGVKLIKPEPKPKRPRQRAPAVEELGRGR